MEKGSAKVALQQLRTLYTLGTLGGLTDAQLLELFLTRAGDDAEDAFAALVRRHGPMVLGVCRRMLPGSHDAEDAFQATFLILVRRAASIGRREQLANWLYGVAVRTAKEARRRAARQQARERRLMESSKSEPVNVDDKAEVLSLLDEELNGLPPHFRAALVACELEGKSRCEAAQELGLPEGTLSSHLARGRMLLRKRLVQRGISLGVGPLAGLPRSIAVVTVPERLTGATIQAALGYAAAGASSGTVPAAVASLVEGVLKMMFLTRLTVFAATLTVVMMAALTAAFAWAAIPARPGEPPQAQVAPKTDTPAKRDSTTTNDDVKTDGKLTLQAVSAATNEPIEGVEISYMARIDKKFQEATITTGEDGTAVIEWAPGSTVQKLWFTARKEKLVPIYILWDDDRHPVKLPKAKELRFEPGTTIGGIVRDEADQPIAGATVHVNAPPTENKDSNSVFTLGEPKTDAQGRWRLDVAPKDLIGIFGNVTHPHYRDGHISTFSRNLDDAVRLSKGLTVTGRVINANGQPVKGARASFGTERFGNPGPPRGTTNERGEFTLENCEAGPSIVTVQAEGLAPRIHEVRVEERTPPVVIKMSEPGSVVRGRVVDVQGKPIAGVSVFADTWREHRSIDFRAETDRDGRFGWRSAPNDLVLYAIFKEDYMRGPLIPLTASEREQTVILYPKLVITGRATDAQTGRPVPNLRIVKGRSVEWRKEIIWAEDEAIEIASGPYKIQFDEASKALSVRVEAPDYKPAQSRPFQPTEGSQTFDFALQRAEWLSGLVLLPTGKPVSGAEVAIATRENSVWLQSGRFNRRARFQGVITGPDGRFKFPPRDDEFVLIAVGDAGYADAFSEEFAKSGKLMLQPWGQIDGGVRIGARAGSGQEVMFQSYPDVGRPGRAFISHEYRTTTDERGRFRFDRFIPGPGSVSRVHIRKLEGRATSAMPCWQEPVYVKPGQTLEVRIGGNGRPVTGRVVLDGVPDSPVDWTNNEPALIDGATRFAANLDKEGRPCPKISAAPTGADP
jgi:RNA polymerase sigma factor (sigma-70 family)